jgi:N-acetylglutamate synthase-like GNAT family acetyltransferase
MANTCFRPCFRHALPHDRRQIRLLLRHCHSQPQPILSRSRHLPQRYESWLKQWHLSWRQLWQYFSLGLLLALGLHWLFETGGAQRLLYGVLGLIAVALAGWLNLQLFADWRNYWVVAQDKQLLACGKLTPYRTYAVLSDVVVAPGWRGQRIGSLLVGSIVDQAVPQVLSGSAIKSVESSVGSIKANMHHAESVYLACVPQLIRFYEQFGFKKISAQELTTHLKRELGLKERRQLEAMILLKPK